MNGYIAIVRPHGGTGYEVRFPDLDGCRCSAPTVEDAYRQAQRTLSRYARRLSRAGGRLPKPRPSYEMASEARRLKGVAAMCLAPT